MNDISNHIRVALAAAAEEFVRQLQKTSEPKTRAARSRVLTNGHAPKKHRGRPGVPAEVVAQMRKLKASGMPAQKIAKQVGLSHFTVYKYTRA